MGQPQAEDGRAPGTVSNHENQGHTYVFGNFRLDVATYEFRRDGEALVLPPKVFTTLLVLLKNRERAVTKDELIEQVWPDSNVTEDSLTHCISSLRRILGDDPIHPRFIATVARRGYRFIAEASEINDGIGPAAELAAAEREREADGAARPAAWPDEGRSTLRPGRMHPPRWASSAALIGIGVAMGVLGGSRLSTFGVRQHGPGKLRFAVEAPEGTVFNSGGVLSPNGQWLAFVAEEEQTGVLRLGVKALNASDARFLPGTEGATHPFWAPDSRNLGFFADGKLKRVGLDSGPPQVLQAVGPSATGGTWSLKGVILYGNQRSGLFSIPETGGTASSATQLDVAHQEVGHRWPQFLPDGKHFLYFNTSASPGEGGTYLGALDSHTTQRLLEAQAVYAAPGSLIYVRDRLLMRQPFDAQRLKLDSAATVVDPAVLTVTNGNAVGVTASDNGLLAFGGYPSRERIEWFDRSGRSLSTIETPTAVHNPAISPDRKQVLVGSREVEHGIWLVDLDRGAATRVVPDGMRPQWSPDGRRIAYAADRLSNVGDIFLKAMNARDDELLLRTAENKMVDDWSPDGKYLVFSSVNPQTKSDIWLLPIAGDRKPRIYLHTPADELQGQISPDGHWMAYTSNESGIWEVYLQSFPEPGAKRAISIGGGTEPHWRDDGRELFYLSLVRTLMSVEVALDRSSATIGRARPLFRAAIPAPFSVFRDHYAVSADGQRFLICAVDRKRKDELVTVLANWTEPTRR